MSKTFLRESGTAFNKSGRVAAKVGCGPPLTRGGVHPREDSGSSTVMAGGGQAGSLLRGGVIHLCYTCLIFQNYPTRRDNALR